ncbi:MAG: caspase family protein [Bacteroidales bacterium]|nr:caspase family protein [Bacteroidales bacterium]
MKIPSEGTFRFDFNASEDFKIYSYPYYRAGRILSERYSVTYDKIFKQISDYDFCSKLVYVCENLEFSDKYATKSFSNIEIDVDINIPENSNQNDYKFALVIGNEDYSKYQTNLNSEVNVDYAINDAEVFAKYCKNVLGVPENNVFLFVNSSSTEMKREINKLAKMMMYTQGDAQVIFYYAGHGIPHETTKESYLMPVNVSAQNIEDGVKLSWLYSKLTEYNSRYVLVFLDACFSGGSRNQGLLATRGVKIKPKEDIISGNCIAFTSSSDIQSSLPYKDKQHGMFTYFLLKKLQESKGNITLGELSDYLYRNVALSSLMINNKEQTPKTLISNSFIDDWKQIKLNK